MTDFAAIPSDYDRGWDEGHAAIWDEPVCSICGVNHDRDESAMCEYGEVVAFSEWRERTGRWLSSRQIHPDQVRQHV